LRFVYSIFILGFNSGSGSAIIKLEGEAMNTLPCYENAIIPIEKFTKYALDDNRDPDKAIAFRNALGYTSENVNSLISNIRCNLSCFEARSKGHNGFGVSYECIMNLIGSNGKSANVVTAWIIEDGKTSPRLTSAYVTDKKPR